MNIRKSSDIFDIDQVAGVTAQARVFPDQNWTLIARLIVEGDGTNANTYLSTGIDLRT